MISRLIDTGPLVSYLDASDPAHGRVASRVEGLTGRLATSSAVVTEAMHFVSGVSSGPRLLAEFMKEAGVDVFDLSRPPELFACVELMEEYSDTPMDFADATLVLLAEGLKTHEILTLDRRGFSTYRTRDGHPFHLMLDS